MHRRHHYEMDMCSGTLLPKIIRFTLPLVLTGVLQLLYNAADVVVVGQFAGEEALAAVQCQTTGLSGLWEAMMI